MDESSKNKMRASEDVALLYSKSEDGKSYGVLRKRKDEIQIGTLRPLEEGKPIHGELVRLKPRSDSPVLFDVESDRVGGTETTTSGPPQVATERYREGWDSIWSEKSGSHALN